MMSDSTDMMGGGMEHPMDTTFSPPLVDPRLLFQFTKAVQQYADTVGRRAEADVKLKALEGKLKNLSDLAQLTRLAVLGHPRSFGRVLDELKCIAIDFPSDPLEGGDVEDEDEPDNRTQFAAVIDLLAGAAFVSKDDLKQRDRLIVGIIRAVEDAIAYPLAFSAEAAAYVGEGDDSLSPAHVSMSIENATNRLMESDVNCDPEVPDDIRLRLENLALKWMAANPVTEMFRALTGPKLIGMLESIDPDDVKVGDRVMLTLMGDCAMGSMTSPIRQQPKTAGATGQSISSMTIQLDGEEVWVLFCPAQPATILSANGRTIVVQVPENARTGPIALVRTPDVADVKYLLKRYACEYSVEWFYCIFSFIGMGKWAYPVAFGPPLVEITEMPSDVTITTTSPNGPVRVGSTVTVDQPVVINYQVNPPGSETNAPLKVDAPGGRVSRPWPGTVVYTPTQPGVSTLQLNWGDVTKTVTVTVAPPKKSSPAQVAAKSTQGGALDE